MYRYILFLKKHLLELLTLILLFFSLFLTTSCVASKLEQGKFEVEISNSDNNLFEGVPDSKAKIKIKERNTNSWVTPIIDNHNAGFSIDENGWEGEGLIRTNTICCHTAKMNTNGYPIDISYSDFVSKRAYVSVNGQSPRSFTSCRITSNNMQEGDATSSATVEITESGIDSEGWVDPTISVSSGDRGGFTFGQWIPGTSNLTRTIIILCGSANADTHYFDIKADGFDPIENYFSIDVALPPPPAEKYFTYVLDSSSEMYEYSPATNESIKNVTITEHGVASGVNITVTTQNSNKLYCSDATTTSPNLEWQFHCNSYIDESTSNHLGGNYGVYFIKVSASSFNDLIFPVIVHTNNKMILNDNTILPVDVDGNDFLTTSAGSSSMFPYYDMDGNQQDVAVDEIKSIYLVHLPPSCADLQGMIKQNFLSGRCANWHSLTYAEIKLPDNIHYLNNNFFNETFLECDLLETVNISFGDQYDLVYACKNASTTSQNVLHNTFKDCRSLQYFNSKIISKISLANNSNNTDNFCKAMFENCIKLKNPPVVFNDDSQSIVENLTVGLSFCDSMFSGCIALVKLPNGFTIPPKIHYINEHFCQAMFQDCTALTSLPNSFDLPPNISHSSSPNCEWFCAYMFKNTGLTSSDPKLPIHIPQFTDNNFCLEMFYGTSISPFTPNSGDVVDVARY